MGGRLSRTKGAAHEREVARMFRAIPGVEMQRTLTETRDGNCGDMLSNLPLSIQCKVGHRPDIYGAVREAVEAANQDQFAVAIVRRNAEPGRPKQDLAILPLDDFLQMVDLFYRRERSRAPREAE